MTLVEPGLYPTQIISNKTPIQTLSRVYSASNNPSSATRKVLETATSTKKSTEKYAAGIVSLSRLDDPPLHLALGMDAIAAIRDKFERVTKELKDYEEWSYDLDV
jgi:hypothetical protein